MPAKKDAIGRTTLRPDLEKKNRFICIFNRWFVLFYYVALYIFFKHYRFRKIHITGFIFFGNDDSRWSNYSSITRKTCRYIWYYNVILGCGSMFCFLATIFCHHEANFSKSKTNLEKLDNKRFCLAKNKNK